MTMLKVQRVYTGKINSQGDEIFYDVWEGQQDFDETKPYKVVPDHDYDYAFDEAEAIENMYSASFHRTNPLD
ncbi:hypothetical protein [Paenibacillus oleatilyticus]|uniref:YopX protein domain-containing protein n=1 Tax=Paenibacillus oleatilyticus TaxID=2594886 RepID=A0ABV4UU82_9BACL